MDSETEVLLRAVAEGKIADKAQALAILGEAAEQLGGRLASIGDDLEAMRKRVDSLRAKGKK
jgi:hypothetical protein